MDKYVLLCNKAGIPTPMSFDKVNKVVVPTISLLTDPDANYMPEKPKEKPPPKTFKNFINGEAKAKKIGTFVLAGGIAGLIAYFVLSKWVFKKDIDATAAITTPNINAL